MTSRHPIKWSAVRFTWNPDKEARNKAKHGLDFSFAEVVFADPLHVVVFDRYEHDGECWHCVVPCLEATASGWMFIANLTLTTMLWFE